MTIINHNEHLIQYKDFVFKNAALSEDLFSFYSSLFSLQYDSTQILKSAITDTTLVVDTTHYPMIHPQNMQFTEEVIAHIKKLFKEIATRIIQFQPGYSFDILLSNLDTRQELYKEIITALLLNDSAFEAIARENNIDTDELVFLAINVYKPLFVALRSAVLDDKTDFPEHFDAFCPFCGFIPDMAKIVESKNNKRFLHCGLCECEWEFKRVKCVACGNENAETLGYYSWELDEKYRFDYCNKCNTYIKTIRIPKQHDAAQFDLTVENIVTTFIDASALKMGYSRQ